jgi:ABC-2 type transport system permease protein
MMTPEKLFNQRVISEWKYNISVWRTVIDWTVALYLIIPFIGFALHQYLGWWGMTPQWLDICPFSAFMVICIIFAWSGTMRIFLREADQLFLLNRKKWINTMVRKGITYSIFWNFFLSVFFFLFLTPFLIGHYQVNIYELIALGLITFLFKVVLGLLKQFIAIAFYGFKQWMIFRVMFVFSSFLFAVVIPHILPSYTLCFMLISILLLVLYILIKKRLNIKGNFLADIDREYQEKLKYVNILLRISGVTIKNPKRQRKRPWLFRHSNLIFKKRTAANGLVEFGIKSTLRNKQRIRQYIEFIFICILTMLGFPSIKWLIWLILAFILTNFVSLDWRESMRSDFVKIFPWKTADRYTATRRYLFWLTLPGFLLITVAMGIQTFSWIGAIAVLPIGAGVVFLMSYIVSLYVIC